MLRTQGGAMYYVTLVTACGCHRVMTFSAEHVLSMLPIYLPLMRPLRMLMYEDPGPVAMIPRDRKFQFVRGDSYYKTAVYEEVLDA